MKKKILVVDDELSIRMLLENFLGDDYEVITKENGYEALSWLQDGNKSDLILVDIDMPMLNGYDLTESIRKQDGMSNVPVIMLSSKQKSADRIKSFEVGADDYLQKPFNPEELQIRIQAIFRRLKVA
ncbi:MAG TPA: response regulator transcription factor [Bacteroidia bacterium]|jgi:DNA-binding response OmpR family regulator|nr:response regulator transcription factor [Bacteroidia bacterium]HQK97047.1 response regulator transcription factor [Bacteroidia bacterium]